ncbi:MAG: hypothetical protein K0R08_247 [Solimicrobium sp.]|nr:hypothetical protein [Solimicrobium sp.]
MAIPDILIPRFIQRWCLPKANPDSAVIRTVGVLLKFEPDREKMIQAVTDSLMEERFDTSVRSLATKTLTTIVIGLLTLSAYAIYTAVMDIVDVCCADADEEECRKLIKHIFLKLSAAETDLADVVSRTSITIDLNDENKYKLEGEGRTLILRRCNAGTDEQEDKNWIPVASFPDVMLGDLQNKLDALPVFPQFEEINNDFMVAEESKNQVAEQNNPDREFSNREKIDEINDDFVVLGESNGELAEQDNYERDFNNLKRIAKNPEAGFDSRSLELALRQLCEPIPLSEEFLVNSTQIVTKDLVVNTWLITDVKEIQSWIHDHNASEHKDKIALIPYGAKNRGFGLEDHMTLLVASSGEVMLIDPKLGFMLGVEKVIKADYVKELEWQDLMDTVNCGFFVYYMIEQVIKASLEKTFNFSNDGRKTATQLFSFIRSLQTPLPKDIRNGISRISDLFSSKGLERNRAVITQDEI